MDRWDGTPCPCGVGDGKHLRRDRSAGCTLPEPSGNRGRSKSPGRGNSDGKKNVSWGASTTQVSKVAEFLDTAHSGDVYSVPAAGATDPKIAAQLHKFFNLLGSQAGRSPYGDTAIDSRAVEVPPPERGTTLTLAVRSHECSLSYELPRRTPDQRRTRSKCKGLCVVIAPPRAQCTRIGSPPVRVGLGSHPCGIFEAGDWEASPSLRTCT